MYKILVVFLGCAAYCHALIEQPWLDEAWQWRFASDFTYSRFRFVEGARVQLPRTSNDYLLGLNLSVTPSPFWNVQVEMEFADTLQQSMGLRSAAALGRLAWLDDIAGDPVSCTTGFTLRGVSNHSLHDVSAPYHSDLNFEVHTAFGKEVAWQTFWKMRTFGLAAVGIANHGAPWMRFLGAFERNWANHHRLYVFAQGYLGFGRKQHVDVNHFRGWGRYHHQSIDLGIAYGYHWDIFGELSVRYDRRVFAKTFSESVNSFTLCYQIPFSPF